MQPAPSAPVEGAGLSEPPPGSPEALVLQKSRGGSASCSGVAVEVGGQGGEPGPDPVRVIGGFLGLLAGDGGRDEQLKEVSRTASFVACRSSALEAASWWARITVRA
jgi:hypothetical protein